MKNRPCGRHEQSCHLVSARPSAWWCCGSGHVTSPKRPTGALQTHARLLVRNGSPWPCSQGHGRGPWGPAHGLASSFGHWVSPPQPSGIHGGHENVILWLDQQQNVSSRLIFNLAFAHSLCVCNSDNIHNEKCQMEK